MQEKTHNKLAHENVGKLIFKMSVPAMFSMLIQALYNIVDSAFVARIGTDALTAVSLAFPIQILIVAVAVGTGVGVNSLISRRLGEKRQAEADSAATHGIILAALSAIPFILFGVFFSRGFSAAFTASETVASYGATYLFIVCVFSFTNTIQIMMEKVLQATGNMIWPMIFQLIGAVLNIILDPILIFGYFGFPAMGVAGAAIATVFSLFVAMVFSLYVAMCKSHGVSFHLKGFKFSLRTVKNIYAVGAPSIDMQSVSSVMNMGLNGILAAFSDTAVAILGIYYKLQSFVFMPVFGLNSGAMPILGFNYGARNKKRFMSAFKIALISAAAIMTVGFAVFNLIPIPLLSIFKESGAETASSELVTLGVPALRTISLSFIPAAFSIICSTMFQAAGKGKNSLIISLARQLILILPMAYFFSKISLEAVWYAFPAAEIAALVMSLVISVSFYKKHIANLNKNI